MKKYLLIALAALGFAACADIHEGVNPSVGGEVEESYIAINLMSADLETRAATDGYGYEDGTEAERAIKTAYFFFFDAAGNPFNVVAQNGPAVAPGGGVNHLSLTIDGNVTEDPDSVNVSDIKNAVVVLSTYKGQYPSKIVAVLNWVPNATTAYSLADLHNALEAISGKNGFVMSNSVYMDKAGNMIDAVPLTAANIKTSADEATKAPVEIYVERIAAKVTLTANGKVEGTTNIFDTQKNTSALTTMGSLNDIDVYVQLHGWELYNDYTTSYLLKNIDTNWSVDDLGLTWNDSPYYRSYWAASQNTDLNDKFSWSYAEYDTKGFHTTYGFNVASSANYEGTYTYCGENTNDATKRTKVILKGQLMQKKGENYDPLELARWYGTEYAGEEALRIAVANSLKYTLFYKESEDKFVGIKPEDLGVVAGKDVGAQAYEVGFQLSTYGQNKEWYLYSSTEGYQLLGNADGGKEANVAATNVHLKTVEPAILYTSGQTYYIVDIKHLGTTGKGAEYGVVRNHVYQIDIQSIKGYGSPVYGSTSDIVNPEYPKVEDESSYVAARINVLSWKVVKQGVDIGQ